MLIYLVIILIVTDLGLLLVTHLKSFSAKTREVAGVTITLISLMSILLLAIDVLAIH
jgi:hypothetical protein